MPRCAIYIKMQIKKVLGINMFCSPTLKGALSPWARSLSEAVQCYYWPPGGSRALRQQPTMLFCSGDFLVNIFLVCDVCVLFSGSRLLQPAQVCDVLKGFIMVLCYSMMSYVDYAMMYHLIRGQSVIKLYIIYNMLEVHCVIFLIGQFSI